MASKKKNHDNELVKHASLADAGLESYEVVEIHRSQIKNAPYNPRSLDDQAKRRLKAGLKRHGLVAPITWNEATGNIVGGHQRTSIMDALMGTKDYTLKVAKVSVTVGREKELNVLLNNAAAMGDWDLSALSDLLNDKEVVIEGTGFEVADVYRMFGEAPMQDRADEMTLLAKQLAEVQGAYGSVRKSNKDKNSQDFYLVVVFKSKADCDGFIAHSRLPDNRYQSGEDIKVLAGMVDEDGAPLDFDPADESQG